MENANPSLDPANTDTLVGAFREILNKMLQNTDGMLPAQVIAYEAPTANSPARVSVQPLIQMITTAGDIVSRAQIAKLPVLQIGGGGFILNFPIQTGDFGWIMANDRDISIFLQTYAQAAPNTNRKKNFADAIFIPCTVRGYTIASGDAANATFQSLDGTVRVSLGSTTITLTAPNVIINGTLQTQNIDIDGNITVTSPPLIVA